MTLSNDGSVKPTTPTSVAKTYNVGDTFFHGTAPALFGEVVKVGRKWIHVEWEDFGGATWIKRHMPEWLDGMDLHMGDRDYTPWRPNVAEVRDISGNMPPIGARMEYLYATKRGHILKAGVVVIGHTPKRVRVRAYLSRSGAVVTRTVAADSLRDAPHKALATHPQGIVESSGHIPLDEWLAQPTRQWRELEDDRGK